MEQWLKESQIAWDKRLNWRNPYVSALAILDDDLLAGRAMYYSHKFPFMFCKEFNAQRDLLNEILLNVLKEGVENVNERNFSALCRRTVSRYLATNYMHLSGYSNIKSYKNRMYKLEREYGIANSYIWNNRVPTEYEKAIMEVEKMINSHHIMDEARLFLESYKYEFAKIAIDYIDGSTYAELSKKYNMSKYKIHKNIEVAQQEMQKYFNNLDLIIIQK